MTARSRHPRHVAQLLSSEVRLKADVLEEAQRYGNKILLHGERMPEADGTPLM